MAAGSGPKQYRIKATVESTGGSVYNINAVLSGDLDFGIAQSDRQYQAIEGLAEWQEAGGYQRPEWDSFKTELAGSMDAFEKLAEAAGTQGRHYVHDA